MRHFYLILFSVFLSAQVWAFDHLHTQLTQVLRKHVKMTEHASTVDYEGLKAEPEVLNKYLSSLSAVKAEKFQKFTEKQKISFLSNAYNAFTLKLIVDNYPIKSIKKISSGTFSFFSSPWKIEFIQLLGKKISLDEIEHGMLRKNYNEPRIHFAVNCASIGCPRLLNEAFIAERLDQQLDMQGKAFLTDTSRNRIDFKNKKIYLSKIFSWFSEDFTKGGKTTQSFVLPYMLNDKDKIKQAEDFSLSYTSYNWDLNK